MNGSNVAFRLDASLTLGTGHLMRCLTLAQELRRHGARCRFVCRPHAGRFTDLLRAHGHEVVELSPTDTDDATVLDTEVDAAETRDALAGVAWHWLVVDHYGLGATWVAALRGSCRRIFVIDDLANREYDADLLLDQNLGRQPEDYLGRVPAKCRLLIGPVYALLRPQFAQLRRSSLERRAGRLPSRLLIAMGGVDKHNDCGNVLAVLRDMALPPPWRLTVVMGSSAPHLATVQKLADSMPWPTQVRVGVSDMAELMADSDLAIGAAGISAWERCCMGLPTLLRMVADNQRDGAMALQAAGCVLLLHDVPSLRHAFAGACKPARLRQMQLACSRVTDGEGVRRVLSRLV